MFSSFVRAFFIAALAARHVIAEDLTLSTPTLTQCQKTSITWTGGDANFLVSVVPASDPCADSIVDIPQTGQNSLEWTAVIPAGSKVELMVEDSTGAESWSGVITVGASNDTSCIDQKAAQALVAGGSLAANSTPSAAHSAATPSNAGSIPPSAAALIPSAIPYPSKAPVVPTGVGVGVGNVGNSTLNPQGSGSIPRAALSVGSLFGTLVFAFAVLNF